MNTKNICILVWNDNKKCSIRPKRKESKVNQIQAEEKYSVVASDKKKWLRIRILTLSGIVGWIRYFFSRSGSSPWVINCCNISNFYHKINTVCPGSVTLQKKYQIYLYQKVRFTPFINYYDTSGWLLFVYRAKWFKVTWIQLDSIF